MVLACAGSSQKRGLGRPGEICQASLIRLMMIVFRTSSNVGLLLHDNTATLDEFLDALHYVPVECPEGV